MTDLIPPGVLYFPWFSQPSVSWLKSALLLADRVGFIKKPSGAFRSASRGELDADAASIRTLVDAGMVRYEWSWDSFLDEAVEQTRNILSSLTTAEVPVLEERFARVLGQDGLGDTLNRFGPSPHPGRALAVRQIAPTPWELYDDPYSFERDPEEKHPVTAFREMLEDLGFTSRMIEGAGDHELERYAPHVLVEVPPLVAGIHRYAMALTLVKRRGNSRLCTDDVQAFALSGIGARLSSPEVSSLQEDADRLIVSMNISMPDLDKLPLDAFVEWHTETVNARKALRSELNKRLGSLPSLTTSERKDLLADMADTASRRLTDRLSAGRGDLTKAITITTVVPVVGGALDLALQMGGPGAAASIMVGAAGAMSMLRGRFTANDWTCYLLSARRLVESQNANAHQDIIRLIRRAR